MYRRNKKINDQTNKTDDDNEFSELEPVGEVPNNNSINYSSNNSTEKASVNENDSINDSNEIKISTQPIDTEPNEYSTKTDNENVNTTEPLSQATSTENSFIHRWTRRLHSPIWTRSFTYFKKKQKKR